MKEREKIPERQCHDHQTTVHLKQNVCKARLKREKRMGVEWMGVGIAVWVKTTATTTA